VTYIVQASPVQKQKDIRWVLGEETREDGQ
jgi:hypothetical protein